MDTTTASFTQRYVRKPLYVEAVQITEDNFGEVARWCTGDIKNLDETPVEKGSEIQPLKQYIHVRVHNPKNPSQTKGKVGDWILYTDRGYKVYTPKAFAGNFDLLSDPE